MNITHELIRECISGNQQKINQLYKLLFSPLMKICYRYAACKDDAIIYLNNAFLRILEKLQLYKEEFPFDVWAKKITVNSVLNDLQKDKSWRSKIENLEDYENILKDPQYDHFIHQELTSQEIMDLLQKLPEPGKTILNLYVFEGFTHKEIAEILEISEESSRWHLHKVKNMLKIQLQTFFFNLEAI
jgi:RNA polymerase sigma-70 factor (ECF subfamily)